MGLNFTKISATIIQVVWRRPQITNGDILSYSIIVTTSIGPVFQRTISGNQSNVLVTNLSMYTCFQCKKSTEKDTRLNQYSSYLTR